MSKRESFEHDLARLTAIRADPQQPGAADELRRALAARSNLLTARAAEIVGEWALAGYVPELVAAFERFLVDAVRRDPTCAAKVAIAEALAGATPSIAADPLELDIPRGLRGFERDAIDAMAPPS